jgi:hypothetical protein
MYFNLLKFNTVLVDYSTPIPANTAMMAASLLPLSLFYSLDAR